MERRLTLSIKYDEQVRFMLELLDTTVEKGTFKKKNFIYKDFDLKEVKKRTH